MTTLPHTTRSLYSSPTMMELSLRSIYTEVRWNDSMAQHFRVLCYNEAVRYSLADPAFIVAFQIILICHVHETEVVVLKNDAVALLLVRTEEDGLVEKYFVHGRNGDEKAIWEERERCVWLLNKDGAGLHHINLLRFLVLSISVHLHACRQQKFIAQSQHSEPGQDSLL